MAAQMINQMLNAILFPHSGKHELHQKSLKLILILFVEKQITHALCFDLGW